MNVTAPRKLGRFQIHCLSDGHWRMDGGSVFGVVPKVLWEKLKPPDARNRILMATNCMLVRTPDANILIEAGMGPKLSDKERDIYAFERDPGILERLGHEHAAHVARRETTRLGGWEDPQIHQSREIGRLDPCSLSGVLE